MKYTIFFSLFGKKMQWTTEANSPQDAEYKLRGKIIVEKIEDKSPIDFDSLNKAGFEFLNDIVNGYFNKR